LDGGSVLEEGQGEGGIGGSRLVGSERQQLFALPLVVIAEAVLAHGGRAAMDALGHDVRALVRQTDHEISYPSPLARIVM
jgi:hypothetical protein